jgi:hypothetical protein
MRVWSRQRVNVWLAAVDPPLLKWSVVEFEDKENISDNYPAGAEYCRDVTGSSRNIGLTGSARRSYGQTFSREVDSRLQKHPW